ncbi:MAG: PEGA domain-containing protein [Myxococcota bacterium]
MSLPQLVIKLMVLAVVALWPVLTVASAPESEPNKEALIQRAQTLVNEASRAFGAKDYGRALGALREAETLAFRAEDPSLPRIRFNVARCLEELQQWDEALAAYERYNELPDASHRKQRAWSAMQTLRGRVYATLSVVCSPPGSLVEIAGMTKGAVGCPWQNDQIRPGVYAVKVSHPGYESTVRTIEVRAGKAFNVEATLKPLAPPPSAVAFSPQRPVNYLPWVTMGAGMIVEASGGFFTSRAIDNRDEIETLPPGDVRGELQDDFTFNRNFSYAMYGTGAALAVGGLVWWLLDRSSDDESTDAYVEPTPSGIQVRF